MFRGEMFGGLIGGPRKWSRKAQKNLVAKGGMLVVDISSLPFLRLAARSEGWNSMFRTVQRDERVLTADMVILALTRQTRSFWKRSSK